MVKVQAQFQIRTYLKPITNFHILSLLRPPILIKTSYLLINQVCSKMIQKLAITNKFLNILNHSINLEPRTKVVYKQEEEMLLLVS